MGQRPVGRPATGQNTKVVRVPKSLDITAASILYYDWLPTIERYRELAIANSGNPRYDRLAKLLDDLGTLPL